MASIQIDRAGAVLPVTLNRPDVRNAFNEELIAELTAWARAPLPGDVRVVVLRGSGPVFCAGADLTWMSKMVGYTREENVRDAMAMAEMFQALDTLGAPVLGRIHGAALGGGAGLAAVCDIVIAEDRAVFGFTETKLGILPAVISPFVVAKIGTSAARELFLTGMRFDAHKAQRIGLIHDVVPAAQLDEHVQQYVKELLGAAPEAIATAKELLRNVAGRPARDVAGITAETLATRRVSAEGQEGLKAFLEKRKATWNVS